MTLRAKLALSFGLVGLVASSLVGVFAFRATDGELDAVADEFIVTRAEEIAGGTRDRPGRRRGDDGRRDDGAGDLVDELRFAVDADSIAQTVTQDGTVLTSSVVLPITDNVGEMVSLVPGVVDTENVRFDDIEIDGDSFRMGTIALPGGGAVQVARATGESEEVLSALVARFALIAAGVTLLGAALGWMIAQRATRPLRRLAGVAGEVAVTGDLTTDVEVGGRDEIGQLAASFRAMLDALEESREQQHRLVHDAGHELRTPLTSLRANVALLERFEQMGTDDRREIVVALQSELVELGDLFTELIELATEQRDEVELVEVDLDDVVAAVADRWRRRSDRSIVVESAPTTVMGDGAQLDRALTNLVSNADKFSPPGTPIDIVSRGGRVCVRDEGPGVPVGDRRRIFDRFSRSEHTRSMPGSGLGLAIVAQIVERHGGSVFVDDGPRGGAEIGFVLPVVDGA